MGDLPQTRLMLFDIDGTLIQSQEIDGALYLRSLAEVFGFDDVNSDWSTYRHTTDSGILLEVFETRLGRAPSALERTKFHDHFVNAVAAAARRSPFREVAGARRILDHIRTLPGHHVGLATGGWSDSARCKMRSAGMNYDAFATASADDANPRVAIMQIAIERARTQVGCDRFQSVVYIGDAVWDARACRELGIPFIGIASLAQAESLRAEGSATVFSDYRDQRSFCNALTVMSQV